MPTLRLTDEQVIELVKQLTVEQQETLREYLFRRQQSRWEELSRLGLQRIRAVAAERGKNWDGMTDQEQEEFIDDLVHEDRHCSG